MNDKIKVLVVDDNEGVCKMLKKFFDKLNIDAFTAKNGVEAVEIIKAHENEIRLIFSDKDMPEMGGLELLEWVRSRHKESVQRIPFVLMSGLWDKETAALAEKMGALEVALKPLALSRIKKIVEEVVC